MGVNVRVKQFMDYKGLSSSDFADQAGIQSSTFSHFINGRNKASLDVITKIDRAFKEVNLSWLLYGTGEMLLAAPSSDASNSSRVQAQTLFDDSKLNHHANNSLTESLSAIPNITAQQQLPVSNEPIKSPRKITEIRVFYDDNTYEIFKMDK